MCALIFLLAEIIFSAKSIRLAGDMTIIKVDIRTCVLIFLLAEIIFSAKSIQLAVGIRKSLFLKLIRVC